MTNNREVRAEFEALLSDPALRPILDEWRNPANQDESWVDYAKREFDRADTTGKRVFLGRALRRITLRPPKDKDLAIKLTKALGLGRQMTDEFRAAAEEWLSSKQTPESEAAAKRLQELGH